MNGRNGCVLSDKGQQPLICDDIPHKTRNLWRERKRGGGGGGAHMIQFLVHESLVGLRPNWPAQVAPNRNTYDYIDHCWWLAEHNITAC